MIFTKIDDSSIPDCYKNLMNPIQNNIFWFINICKINQFEKGKKICETSFSKVYIVSNKKINDIYA